MRKSSKAQKSKKFFHPRVHSGWKKTQGATTRRKLVLKAHKGDELATARALQALANVTRDNATAQLARQDALYFYARHRGKQK